MIAFLFICLLPAALLFAALSIVLLALMLETCAPRSGPAAHDLSIPRPASVDIPTVHGLQLS